MAQLNFVTDKLELELKPYKEEKIFTELKDNKLVDVLSESQKILSNVEKNVYQ